MGKTIKVRHEIPAACDERFAPIHSQTFVPWRKLGIMRSGISHLCPGYHMGRVHAPQQMLILNHSGRGYAFSEDEEWQLEPGTLFMSAADQPIAFGCDGDHWQIYWWYVHADTANTFDYVYEPCEDETIISASMEALFRETGIIEQNNEWSQQAATMQTNNRSQMLSELIADYLSPYIQVPAQQQLNSQQQQLMAMWREVDRNLHKDWSMRDFAAFLHISTATVQRWIQKYYQTSCHQMLIERRMLRASQLLLHTDYPIEAIAQQLAYCDGFTFSNAFKLKYGVSPSHYRKEQG